MDYVGEIKKYPEVYEELAKFASRYIGNVAKENAFPAGNRPSNEEAKKILHKIGLELDDISLDSLLSHVTEDIFMNR